MKSNTNITTKNSLVVIALDLGGTWVKGTALSLPAAVTCKVGEIRRWPNPLHTVSTGEEFSARLADICHELSAGAPISAVVAATAGEVNAAGNRYRCAGKHLGVMGSAVWVEKLELILGCSVTLINDAEAFLLGFADSGGLPFDKNVGALVLGTGLGFSVVRQGRLWKPNRRLQLFGDVETSLGDYNHWVSAVRASEKGVFQSNATNQKEYLHALTSVVATAGNLFHLDFIVLGGGAVDAARSIGLDLIGTIKKEIPNHILPGNIVPEIVVATEGNQTILRGALALAIGNSAAESVRFRGNFNLLSTETTHPQAAMDTLSAEAIVKILANAEKVAAEQFCGNTSALARGAEMVGEAIKNGGRIIYVGAGTSGRVGAMDAVEIPCTFGLSPDRFVAVIAGGIADSALSIEAEHEEDYPATPDLLLLTLTPQDLVIGISASGTAFFVRSALAFARTKGAKTIFIHEADLLDVPHIADHFLRLASGSELVGGSTRMKAGTATKKALNILSTTAMVILGKAQQGEMLDLDPLFNAKIMQRAIRTLARLGGISEEQSAALLAQHNYKLRDALDSLKNEKCRVT